MAVASIFRALGDPVRLEMMQRLSRAPSTISKVSEGLGITRQGARKHLRTLADAGLVSLRPKGRDVFVELDAQALDQAREFIASLERQWDRRLDALRGHVESESIDNRQ